MSHPVADLTLVQPAPLVLRGRVFDAGRPAVMAIVNRTDDSFFVGNRYADLDSAMRALDQAIDEGADIVDVGGVRAGQEGEPVSAAQEIERVLPFLERARAAYPDVVLSLDTWRSEVARAAAPAGVDLVNDTWAGHDPELVGVAAELGAGVVVSHTGGLPPRTDPVDVSFVLRKGEVTALVGQSGSGKSTLARMITGVESPTSGRIVFHGKEGEQEVAKFRGRALRRYRQHVQMVFQDPYSSLNPSKTLGYTLARPLANHQGLRGKAAQARVDELLETVALTPPSRYRNRFAYELSGGQRQRVVIARALAAQPELIVADEPISSLDVSIRAEILELLNNLVHDSDVGILYITHDLLSARMLSDEVIVLNEGVVVETGPSLRVIREPEDDYTRRLIEAIPNPFQDAPRPGDSMAG